ncbi:hypothetical protein GBAR_LOCUS6130, partial [Geodia barretti]
VQKTCKRLINHIFLPSHYLVYYIYCLSEGNFSNFFNGVAMVADHPYKVVQTILISLERLSLYCKEGMYYTHRTQLRLQGNHPDTHT